MHTLKIGSKLTARQQSEVLNGYVYRNTIENRRQRRELFTTGAMKTCTATPQTDIEWLNTTAFYVNKDGSLNRRNKHCMSGVDVKWVERFNKEEASV